MSTVFTWFIGEIANFVSMMTYDIVIFGIPLLYLIMGFAILGIIINVLLG